MTTSTASPRRFVVVGAYVLDCVAPTPRLPAWGESHQAHSVALTPGGKALNQAVALARRGAHVSAVGAVGDDLAGRTVLDALVRENVDITSMDVRTSARTPICVCLVGDDAETAFLWRVDESVAATTETIRAAAGPLADADTVLITFEAPSPAVHHAIVETRRGGGLVVLQPAPTSDQIVPADVPWADVDVLVPNEHEARALLSALADTAWPVPRDDLALRLGETTGVPIVVVTLGRAGCVVHAPGNRGHRPAPPAGEVRDTTGASDVFVATLAYRLTSGAGLATAVDDAQVAAVRAISAVPP